jgi:hypothetical protein
MTPREPFALMEGTICRLLGEPDAAQQVSETRITSQRIESGIHPDRGHSIRTVVKGPIKPGKGSFLVSQSRIDASDVESADIAPLRLALDPREHCACLIFPTSEGIGGCYVREGHGTLNGSYGAIGCGDRLFGLA